MTYRCCAVLVSEVLCTADLLLPLCAPAGCAGTPDMIKAEMERLRKLLQDLKDYDSKAVKARAVCTAATHANLNMFVLECCMN